MARNRQLILICMSVLVLCSAFSHLAARVLKLRTEPISRLTFGETNLPPAATIGGSSLTFYGIEWNTLAQQLDAGMIGWGVPAGSVHELEILQRRPPPPGKWTFLGVSLFDLNENYISDFRADIVPVGEAFSSLRASQSSWAHSKRVLAQYPMKYIREVFPTAGRSMAVMVGIRAELKGLLRRQPNSGEEPDRAVLSSQSNPHQEGIDAWAPARRLRNLGTMRARTGSELVYGGQKWLSLLRYVERGTESGQVILVVIPESPTYRAELVAPAAIQQFEARLGELHQRFPNLVCVRLDQVPELRSDALYWDLVHLNAPGQEIATKVLLARLKEAGIQR
jgi:hypothetical protein